MEFVNRKGVPVEFELKGGDMTHTVVMGSTRQGMSAAPMTKQEMHDRISLLSSEIDANEDENRLMQDEINRLTAALAVAESAGFDIDVYERVVPLAGMVLGTVD